MASSLVPLGGVAAIVGGLLWILKGAAILLPGDQSRYLFEVALLSFRRRANRPSRRPYRRGGLPGWEATWPMSPWRCWSPAWSW
jgi:hypothetical protein